MAATFGWLSLPAARASARKRPSAVSSADRCSARTLIATSRWIIGSCALTTTPIPPCPSTLRTWYFPSDLPSHAWPGSAVTGGFGCAGVSWRENTVSAKLGVAFCSSGFGGVEGSSLFAVTIHLPTRRGLDASMFPRRSPVCHPACQSANCPTPLADCLVRHKIFICNDLYRQFGGSLPACHWVSGRRVSGTREGLATCRTISETALCAHVLRVGQPLHQAVAVGGQYEQEADNIRLLPLKMPSHDTVGYQKR